MSVAMFGKEKAMKNMNSQTIKLSYNIIYVMYCSYLCKIAIVFLWNRAYFYTFKFDSYLLFNFVWLLLIWDSFNPNVGQMLQISSIWFVYHTIPFPSPSSHLLLYTIFIGCILLSCTFKTSSTASSLLCTIYRGSLLYLLYEKQNITKHYMFSHILILFKIS